MLQGLRRKAFLKFDFVGGVDRRVAIGKPVVLGENEIPGLIGLKAIHLVSREEEEKVPKTDALYIDIGAKDRKRPRSWSRLAPTAPLLAPQEFGQGLLEGQGH